MAPHTRSYFEQDPSDYAVMDGGHTALQDSCKAPQSSESGKLQERQGSQEDLNHAKGKRDLETTITESGTGDVEVSHPDAIQGDHGIPMKRGQYTRPDSAGVAVRFAFGPGPDRRLFNPVRVSYTVQHPSLQTAGKYATPVDTLNG